MATFEELDAALKNCDFKNLLEVYRSLVPTVTYSSGEDKQYLMMTWREYLLNQALCNPGSRDLIETKLRLPVESSIAAAREERMVQATEMAAKAAVDSSAMAQASAEAARESVRIANSSLRLAESVRRLTWIAIAVAGVSAVAQVVGLFKG